MKISKNIDLIFFCWFFSQLRNCWRSTTRIWLLVHSSPALSPIWLRAQLSAWYGVAWTPSRLAAPCWARPTRRTASQVAFVVISASKLAVTSSTVRTLSRAPSVRLVCGSSRTSSPTGPRPRAAGYTNKLENLNVNVYDSEENLWFFLVLKPIF